MTSSFWHDVTRHVFPLIQDGCVFPPPGTGHVQDTWGQWGVSLAFFFIILFGKIPVFMDYFEE
jgi:hypothetical protein